MRSKDPVGEAIAALTEAALGTRTIGAGGPHEHRERVDFGEIACHVLTAVAANVGGEADLVAAQKMLATWDWNSDGNHRADALDDLALGELGS